MPTSVREHSLFPLFCGNTGGIDSWLGGDGNDLVIERLNRIQAEPITCGQLNQLFALSHQASVSNEFFDYYWCKTPTHPYEVTKLPGYAEGYDGKDLIRTWDQLFWGLYRIYVDSLLYFGSIRSGYRALRNLNRSELTQYFDAKRHDDAAKIHRGTVLPLHPIAKDHRYLISEMACKNFDSSKTDSQMEMVLVGAWAEHQRSGGGRITAKKLLEASTLLSKFDKKQLDLFEGEEIIDEEVETLEQLKQRFIKLKDKWSFAREAALRNTRLYLSTADDLDVYVATSMRTRDQFRAMADRADKIFGTGYLKPLNLRYFDPTMSAAPGHEDKGLIECLMVKCAKVLIYMAGEKDSYGKDAEAAMALSLGKPVIFLCDDDERRNFFGDIHPLSRLVEFSTGVAVGVMATSSPEDVALLLYRIFSNDMEYELEHPQKGYFRLREKLTGSTVRLQTNDLMLRETFWNCYHK